VPSGAGMGEDSPSREPTRGARSRTAEWVTARATQITAVVAALALVVSLVSLLTQLLADRADAEQRAQAELRSNASRVRVWEGNDAIVIQNGSPIALMFPILRWVSRRTAADLRGWGIGPWSVGSPRPDASPPADYDYLKNDYIGLFIVGPTLEPCTRWTLSYSVPEIEPIYQYYVFEGVSFDDANGSWMAHSGPGLLVGPDYRPSFAPGMNVAIQSLFWDPKYARADYVQGCSVSA